ncbi:MAG: rhodanese-like domain-containing protein [Sulfuricaulis sp.]
MAIYLKCGKRVRRRRLSAVFFAASLMIGLVGPAPASDAILSPEEIPGVVKVNAEGLLDLVDKKPNLIIIDARLRQDRSQGYIEGSISLPDIQTTCAALVKTVSHKSAPLLFYCNGPQCGRSAHSSRIALACGYTHVYWFRGGFEEWKKKNYPFLKE